MARNFTITTPTETVRVGPDGRGEMTFTVTNVSGFPTRGLAKIVPQGNTSATWLSLAEVEREFPAGGVHQFRVAANIPPGTPAGKYSWRFDMISAIKSGEASDAGPTVAFEIGATEPTKKGIPWWVWLAIVIGAIVIGVVAWLVMRPKPDDQTPPPDDKPAATRKVKVPKVKGLNLKAAQLTLKKAGLKAKVDEVPVATFGRQLNEDIAQSPEDGTVVRRGETVTITVLVRPKKKGTGK